MKDRQPKYGGRRSKKRYRSWRAALVLVIAAFVIVTGSKIFSGKQEISPSYGSQIAAYQGSEKQDRAARQEESEAGTLIDSYKGVAVYSNGQNFMSSHGLSYSEDGYYYGYKWQCVEFVKRFYYEKYGHKMPDGAGHAKYFYNPLLEQGELNEQRGLVQYENGGDIKPKTDDLLVFADGAYGHVAIVCDVGNNWVEVIQQNSEVTRERYKLEKEDGKYLITGERVPAGWLRIK